jgi:hypothetical protein
MDGLKDSCQLHRADSDDPGRVWTRTTVRLCPANEEARNGITCVKGDVSAGCGSLPVVETGDWHVQAGPIARRTLTSMSKSMCTAEVCISVV